MGLDVEDRSAVDALESFDFWGQAVSFQRFTNGNSYFVGTVFLALSEDAYLGPVFVAAGMASGPKNFLVRNVVQLIHHKKMGVVGQALHGFRGKWRAVEFED